MRRSHAETALKHADEKLSVLSDLEASRWNLAGLIGAAAGAKNNRDIHRLHQFATRAC